MKERDLEILFSDFLKTEKGYPSSSLLYEASIKHRFKDYFNRYFTDLLILDTEFNNYMALVEFKNSADDSTFKSAYERVKQYLKALNKPNLPAYLIVLVDKNFEIYLFSEKNWKKIEKIEFPQYQTLKSKNEADTKIVFEELTEKKYYETKSKKEILKSTALSTLLSLIAGIIAVVIFSLIMLGNQNNTKSKLDSNKDSTKIIVEKLSKSISVLEIKLLEVKNIDTTIKNDSQNKKINELERRLENFENSVSSNPDKLLKLQEINFEFKNLENSISKEKEMNEIKFTNAKEKLEQVIIWTSGLIITIIGSIIGFAFNAFKKS